MNNLVPPEDMKKLNQIRKSPVYSFVCALVCLALGVTGLTPLGNNGGAQTGVSVFLLVVAVALVVHGGVVLRRSSGPR